MAAPIARASLGVDPKNRSCDRQSRMCRGSISCPMKSWLRRTYQVGCTSAGVSGRARVVDGDTLDVGAVRVRLHGVDAPESRQSCVAGGRRWACGERATRALAGRIGGRTVACEERDRDRYGRIVAVCRNARQDVNAWMVSQGWALAYPRSQSMQCLAALQTASTCPLSVEKSVLATIPWCRCSICPRLT